MVNIAIVIIGCMHIILLDHDYLTTGRKEYVVTKNYVLNKHVRLLTRLYGMVKSCACACAYAQVDHEQIVCAFKGHENTV